MANKTIPQLPEQTGKTDNDLLVIVDSGETTTSKIKLSTLLSGLGGTPGVTGDTLNDNISSVNSIVGTPNVFEGTAGYVNFGYGNEIPNDGVIIGHNNTHAVATAAAVPHVVIGADNAYQENATGNEGNVCVGKNNTNKNDAVIFGWNCIGGRGVSIGKGASGSGINSFGAVSIGRNTSVSGNFGVAVGDTNTNIGDGFAYGRNNNHGNHFSNLTLGYNNSFQENGSVNEYNIGVGSTNSVSAGSGIGQVILGNGNTISSTGTRNSILGGTSNTISGSVSGATLVGLSSYTGAATNDSVYMPAVVLTNYASYNFADDATAAANGIQLGQVYHNAGDLRVRIV